MRISYLLARAAHSILRTSGLLYWGERMTALRMMYIVLKVWSVLSVLMLCYDSSKLFCRGDQEEVGVLSCSHSPGAWSFVPGTRADESTLLGFSDATSPLTDAACVLRLQWLFCPPLCERLQLLYRTTSSFVFLGWIFFAAGTFEKTFSSRDWAEAPPICQADA